MAIQDAIQELTVIRDQLTAQLSSLDSQRSEVSAELTRIDEALSALADGLENEAVESRPPAKEHTGKYRALWQALVDRADEGWEATFAEVEGVLGFPLPPSSRKHMPHWYGADGSAVARAIRDAGWRASMVDLQAETVTFRRSS